MINSLFHVARRKQEPTVGTIDEKRPTVWLTGRKNRLRHCRRRTKHVDLFPQPTYAYSLRRERIYDNKTRARPELTRSLFFRLVYGAEINERLAGESSRPLLYTFDPTTCRHFPTTEKQIARRIPKGT